MKKVGFSLIVMILCFGLVSVAMAEGKKILIYGPALATSVTPEKARGESFLPAVQNEATIGAGLGYDVTVASASAWQGMTSAQFASYNAIVFPDDGCSGDFTTFNAANQNKDVWSPVITGRMVLYAADPVYHAVAGDGTGAPKVQLISNALKYAASGPTTGLYVSFSCYVEGNGQRANYLTKVGIFELTHQSSDRIHVQKPNHPLTAGLTDDSLSNWDTTSHSFFTRFPSYFQVIIIRRDEVSGVCEQCDFQPTGANAFINHYMMIAAAQRQ